MTLECSTRSNQMKEAEHANKVSSLTGNAAWSIHRIIDTENAHKASRLAGIRSKTVKFEHPQVMSIRRHRNMLLQMLRLLSCINCDRGFLHFEQLHRDTFPNIDTHQALFATRSSRSRRALPY